MAGSVYVVIDTNILVRVLSQGRPGCEIEKWQELKNLVDENTVRLLVPEVVLLELEKQRRLLPEHIKKNIVKLEGSLKNHLSGAITYSEVQDLGPSLMAHLVDKKAEKINNIERYYHQLIELLRSEKGILLRLDLETWFRGKRRSLSIGLANPDQASEADCHLIESLLLFFEKNKEDGAQLLFCTENTKDFGIETDTGKFSIHPVVREGLPPTELVTNLDSLVAIINQHRAVEEPLPEVIQEALVREQERRVLEEIELEEVLAEPGTNGLFQMQAFEDARRREFELFFRPMQTLEDARRRAFGPLLKEMQLEEARKRELGSFFRSMQTLEDARKRAFGPLLKQMQLEEARRREFKSLLGHMQGVKEASKVSVPQSEEEQEISAGSEEETTHK